MTGSYVRTAHPLSQTQNLRSSACRYCDTEASMSVAGRFCCKSRHTGGAGRLMPYVEAVRCHPLDCAGDLRSTLLTLATLTQRTKGRSVVAGRPTWQACGGSAQSLPT